VLILDDETYVPFDPEEAPGRTFFHSSDPKEAKFVDRVKGFTKFPKKYLVWQALDQNGNVSLPYFCQGSLKPHVYLEG
jgi:hypothetical protein